MVLQRFRMQCLVAVMVVLTAGVASATEAPVSMDTYVNSNFPAVNFGYQSNLYVNATSTSLLGFDLSSLPSGTTSGAVKKATLWLYVNRVNTSGVVSLSPVTSTWSESSVTYNSIPTLGRVVATLTPTTGQQFLAGDVTSLVQGRISSSSSNYGIALSTTTANVLFDSKENGESSHAARLDIELSDATTVSVGTVTTGAEGTSASVINSGSSSAAVLNFRIPQGEVGASSGTEIATYSSGQAYNAGGVAYLNGVLYVCVNAAGCSNENPASVTGYWRAVGGGSGGDPGGIPYTVMAHPTSTAYYFNPLSSTVSTSLIASVTTIAPAECTPSMTMYSWENSIVTYTLQSVTLTLGSTTATAGSDIMSCTTTATAGASCSVTSSSTISAGTVLTLTTGTSPGTGIFYSIFSCL